jgi:hypothetical protein
VAWLAARSGAHGGLAMSQAPVLVPEVACGRALARSPESEKRLVLVAAGTGRTKLNYRCAALH